MGLIQNNRDEIVDSALAQIAVSFPDFFFGNDTGSDDGFGEAYVYDFTGGGDPQTYNWSRYVDAYRLIQNNKQEIIDNSIAAIVAAHPTFVFPGGSDAKCRRDIGYLVDAVSLDIFIGSNKYSRKFISKYFTDASTPLTNGLVGEEAESVTGFNAARDQMRLAVANQLSVQDLTITEGPAQYGGGGGNISRTNSGACDDVQSAIWVLVDIIVQPIGAGNLNSLPAETTDEITGNAPSGPFTVTRDTQTMRSKCRRDLGYFVDAIALDVFIQGNEYTWKFCAEYFNNASGQIPNGLAGEEKPSRYAFTKAIEMIKKAITVEQNLVLTYRFK